MTKIEDDEQFYRDTESVAFPKLDDQQLAMLDPIGSRRIVRRGEVVFKAGQRDLGLTAVVSGELEVFRVARRPRANPRDRGPARFPGGRGDADGHGGGSQRTRQSRGKRNSRSARGKISPSTRGVAGSQRADRQSIHDAPTEIERDREFAGLRILTPNGSRDGQQLDDFLDKNHIPHRLIDFQSDEGRRLSERLHLGSRDLPALVTASGMPLRRPSLREVARIAGLLRPLAGRTRAKLPVIWRSWGGASRSGRGSLCRFRRTEDGGFGKLCTGWTSRILFVDRKLFRLSHRHQRRRTDLQCATSGLPFWGKIFHAGAGAFARL